MQCRIFSTIFNPTGERLGNKILRQRLKGPALAAYYPRRVATFKDFKNLYPGHETYDEFEEDRLEHLQIAKSRGKGAPKKKRTAAGELATEPSAAFKAVMYMLTDDFREQEVHGQEEEVENAVCWLYTRHGWSYGTCTVIWCTLRWLHRDDTLAKHGAPMRLAARPCTSIEESLFGCGATASCEFRMTVTLLLTKRMRRQRGCHPPLPLDTWRES